MRIRRGSISVRLLAIASVAAVPLLGGASSAGASVTVGQVAGSGIGPCTLDADRVQPEVSSSSYVVPGTGGIIAWTVTSWSTNADAVGEMTMKVFRHVSDLEYTVVGHDGPRALSAGSVNTFPASVSAKPGDIIGLNAQDGVGCIFGSPGESYLAFPGDLADGQSGTFTTGSPVAPDNRLNIRAVLDPTNTFTVGAVTRNKKKGSARVAVTVPNPGTVTLSGGGSKAQQASGPAAVKSVSSAGTVRLSVKAKGKKRKKLNSTGKVKVRPTLSFTPTGGTAAIRTVKLKLKKKI
jgi:hypothetical protein